jgi:branched-chain amino acid aminotransferase
MFIYLNGKYLSKDKSYISSKDRGLLLGDGLFETILYKNHELVLYNFHINRLNKSLKKIFINFKLNSKDYKRKITNLIKKNHLINKSLAVRITVTRGESFRGIDISNKVLPTILINTTLLKKNLRFKPVKLGVAEIKRNESSPLSNLKTLNYLDNIVAKKISMNQGYDDVIFLNSKNNVCCCSTSNIYYLIRGKFYTPPLSDGILNGTIRENLIAKKKVAVKSIKLNNLLKCGEIFITNSIFGIRPVTKVLNKKIGKKIEKMKEIEQFLLKLGV